MSHHKSENINKDLKPLIEPHNKFETFIVSNDKLLAVGQQLHSVLIQKCGDIRDQGSSCLPFVIPHVSFSLQHGWVGVFVTGIT